MLVIQALLCLMSHQLIAFDLYLSDHFFLTSYCDRYAHFIRKESVLMVVAADMIMSKFLEHSPQLHLLQ